MDTATVENPLNPHVSVQLDPATRRFLDASRARARHHPASPRRANMTRAFFDLHPRKPYWERYARCMAHALENEPVYLFDDEQLVGMTYQMAPGHAWTNPEDETQWEPYRPFPPQTIRRLEREIEPHLRVLGAPGHIGWRWERVLELGAEGIMGELRTLLDGAATLEARRLYRGALILWKAVLRWNDRHVAALEERRDAAADPAERARLNNLVALCRRVPRQPARTFHEAVQSFHMQHLAVMFENPYGGNGPGRVDALLWPWLERDLEAGRTDLAEARRLVEELFIRFEERLYPGDGWVEALMAGGTRPDGSHDVNPLSYMAIETALALNQTHPSVYVRLGRDTPDDFVELTARYLVHGHNRAQVYNDDACIPAIIHGGVSPRDACDYMAGGCMEISPQGRHSDMNFSCTHNVAKTIELVINGGLDLRSGERRIAWERSLPDYANFEDLYAAFDAEIDREYREMTRALDISSETYERLRPCYLLSSLVDDCLERGLEQHQGGARYHDYGFSPLGVTCAADSLNALRHAVYEEGFVSAEELLRALRAGFEGYEPLRVRLAAIPRFGMENPHADAMCDRVLQTVCGAATRQRTRFGGALKPMLFNFVWTPGASAELGARPDGSLPGDLIGHGLTPRSSVMTDGITPAMNSSTSVNPCCVTGGATTMWDMDPEWIDVPLMTSLLKTFMARGGMIFQGNTTSVREMEEAMENPGSHPNLIVRVGGYSARFNTLSRELQEEIIRRRRHAG